MVSGANEVRGSAAGPMPEDFPADSWPLIDARVQRLLEMPVDSAEAFDAWLLERSELEAACSEARVKRYIRMTCFTSDERTTGEYAAFVEKIDPPLRRAVDALSRRMLDLAERHGHDAQRLGVLLRRARSDVELFRESNLPRFTELEHLSNRYQQVCGAMTVRHGGQERTMPQMQAALLSNDRADRELAFRAMWDRRARDAGEIETLFERMLELRHAVAREAGLGDYRDYAFRALGRFDYGPHECVTFHEAIERWVVPMVRRADARRARSMGLSKLRPWDLHADEQARPALRPFAGGDELLMKCRLVFERMDAELSGLFRQLGENGAPGPCLDLDSRMGKAPGGYQSMLDRARIPFIFMNAVGMHRDIEILVHEAGHAFHAMLCRDEPLVWYREAPIEFCEVASMTMELLTVPYWDAFYASREDLARARRDQFEGNVLVTLAWIAQIDAFQHWLYTHPGHTHEERTACWLELEHRFGREVDWSGVEPSLDLHWHKQQHLFTSPFYYIEYGIARLGSMGLWLAAKEYGLGEALRRYKLALALGGSRPLPELFAAAGLPFEFGGAIVARLVAAVERELAELPV